MKLGALQRKVSCHTRQAFWRVDKAIAPATSPVLTTKYAAIMPTTVRERPVCCRSGAPPLNQTYTAPVA
jgi:hypothetical protein